MDTRILDLLRKKLNGTVSPSTLPSAISRTKEKYPFLTLNAAAEVYGSRHNVSVHKFLNEKDREALGTFAVGKTNLQTKPRVVQTQRTKTTNRLPVQKIGKLESKMEETNDDWDVFICYKRISGEDFAEALKKILEECHVHAFLDIKDIPSRFRGTEKWSDARDNAVVKCKVFVLIMTAGFDSSTEVKKELTLARSIPDKLFTYFRHKDLPPSQKIVLKNEVVDLGTQQQHSFGTSNDLVRTAHKILVTEGIPTPASNNQVQGIPTVLKATTITSATAPNKNGIAMVAAIANFASFYGIVPGTKRVQKLYPNLFTPEEMESGGKESKICKILEIYASDRTQLKQAIQRIINLHPDYSLKKLSDLRDTVLGFGFNLGDDLTVIDPKANLKR